MSIDQSSPTSSHRLREQMRNEFYARRANQAMQYIDPYLIRGAETMHRTFTGATSPDASRRRLYGTMTGQAALDMATLMRNNGLLGYGDPVAYSTNIHDAISRGGFRVSSSGFTPGGSSIRNGAPDIVTGSGVITDRVVQSYQKGLLEELYGKGNADPRKLYGFDMSEASGVFATLAKRGGLGHAAHLEHGASLASRVAAAKQSALDPEFKDALASLDMSGNVVENQLTLDRAISQEENSKVKEQLETLDKSTTAVYQNKDGQKRVASTVREVIKGMSELGGIFKELNSTQLQQKLEEMSGIRVTNLNQAKRARTMISELSGAAMRSGNEELFMEYASQNKRNIQTQINHALGFDSRNAGISDEVAASINTNVMTTAQDISSLSSSSSKAAEAYGINLRPKTTDEIASDLSAGQVQYAERHIGARLASGLDMQGEDAARRKELLDEFANSAGPDKREERQRIEMQLRNLVADVASGTSGKHVTFEQAQASNVGKAALQRSYTDENLAGYHNEVVRGIRQGAVNTGFIQSVAEGQGQPISEEMAGKMLTGLGATGMVKLLGTKDYVAQTKILETAGFSPEESVDFLDQYFTAEGAPKNMNHYRTMTQTLDNTSWGHVSQTDRVDLATAYLSDLGKSTPVKSYRGADGSLSVKGVATALLAGESGGVYDSHSVALSMQAMQDENIAMGYGEELKTSYTDDYGNTQTADLTNSFATGLNFAGGLTKEGLEKLDKVHGGDLDLKSKVGDYKTREELIEATKNDPQILAKAVKTLRSGDYAHLNLSGPIEDMSAITDEGLGMERKTNFAVEKMLQLGGAHALFPGLKEGQSNALIDSIQKGGDLDTDVFRGDASGGNSGNLLTAADVIGSANDSTMTAVKTINKDGRLGAVMQAQYNRMLDVAKEDPGRKLTYIDAAGEKKEASISDLIPAMEKAIAKLSETKNEPDYKDLHVTNLRVANPIKTE